MTRFLRHPSWAVRILRNRIRSARLWRAQGCPTDFPIVLRTGGLEITANGHRSILNWYLDFSKMTEPVSGDDLWYGLCVRYPHLLERNQA